MADFRARVQEAIRDCLVHPDRPDSHVLEAISGRGTLFEVFIRDEAIRRLDALLSEISHAQRLLTIVVAQVTKNQEKAVQTPRQYETGRFRLSALQLLITNRYVEESQSFFRLAERCLDGLNGLNDQLNAWEHSPDNTEKWILKRKETMEKALNLFKDHVTSTYQKLTKQP